MKKFLESRFLLPFLVVFPLVLSVPSIFTGWQQDDLVHRYQLLGYPDVTGQQMSPFLLFDFMSGDSSRTHKLIDLGVVPWWTLPNIRISFWRPLSSLTHWLDYLLWPQSSILMHLQNLFWLAAFILVAALLYRRLLGAPWVAGLAALLFALDDAHGLPAGWIANRNSLVAGFFGLVALLVHDRWRRDNWRAGVLLGPLVLAAALLSGESALAVCGYLLAYALFIDRGERRSRTLSLVPYALVACTYGVAYVLLRYGTWGSGFYVDPLSEPFAFASAIIKNGPLLLADQWALPPSSIVVFLTNDAIVGMWVWALVVIVALSVLLVPLIRRDRTAAFWTTGMLLSLLLVCATMPHSRVLTFVGIGAFGLLAQWMAGAKEGGEWLPANTFWRRLTTPAIVILLVIHLAVAPLLFVFNSTSATFGEGLIQKPAGTFDAGPELASQDLVILNHPTIFLGHYFANARLQQGRSLPRHTRILAPATAPLRVFRPDERTLVVHADGGFLGAPFDNVFRGESHPLNKGEQIELTGMTAEVREMLPDQRPAEVAFRFAVPLEAHSLRWVRWDNGTYAPFTPPAVGESVVVPASRPQF